MVENNMSCLNYVFHTDAYKCNVPERCKGAPLGAFVILYAYFYHLHNRQVAKEEYPAILIFRNFAWGNVGRDFSRGLKC